METKKFRPILPKKVLREVKRVKSENDKDMEQGRKERSKKGKKARVCEKISGSDIVSTIIEDIIFEVVSLIPKQYI